MSRESLFNRWKIAGRDILDLAPLNKTSAPKAHNHEEQN